MGKSNSKGNFLGCGSIKKDKDAKSLSSKNLTYNFEDKLSIKQNYPNLASNSKKVVEPSADFSIKLIGTPGKPSESSSFGAPSSEEVEKISKTPSTKHSSPKLGSFSREESNGRSESLFKPKSANSSNCLGFSLKSFHFIKVIGRGTFGKVILVKNKIDEKLYAMKSLKKIQILKTQNLQNLKNEKRILKTINHPFIIKLNETFQDSHKVYMLFDYHNGGELFFHLQKRGRFSEEMVRFYACEIYLALTHLHSQKIIYRDLKPENVVLDENGHIKLIDFGLAKDEIDLSSKCATFCGTNEYIPPEVIKGAKYNFNFDWWGFGILIYELLFGSPPFNDRGGNKTLLFKKICMEDPDYQHKGVRISLSAESLLKTLLNKDPEKRLRSESIPLHDFFRGISFSDVEKMKIKPPIKPKIKNKEDFSNIDPCFLREDLMSPVKKLKYEIDQSKFIDF
jgi:protein-serine/threonine kinase